MARRDASLSDRRSQSRRIPRRWRHPTRARSAEAPNPENDEWFERQVRDDGQADPYGQGINSVRGSAAEGLASVLLRDKGQAERLRPTIERVSADRTIQVRACAATTLLGLLDID